MPPYPTVSGSQYEQDAPGTLEPGSVATLVHENALLRRLSRTVRTRLEPYLESVHLARGDILFRAHEPLDAAYFPSTAVVCLVSRLGSGERLNVGLIGRDGLAGTAVLPGITTMSWDGIVGIPGMAQRISADVLRGEVLVSESLYSTVGRFAQLLLIRSMQMAVCNAFHSVRQRCVRWLLTIDDLVGQDICSMHALIAMMIGTPRSTVTGVLRALHHEGLVGWVHGRIVIRDRRGLEAACCECYALMRREQGLIMGD